MTSSMALAQADTDSPAPVSESTTMTTRLHAAGSLTVALSDVIESWSALSGKSVSAEFAPSGLLRERIEAGEPAQVFASANMRHPENWEDKQAVWG